MFAAIAKLLATILEVDPSEIKPEMTFTAQYDMSPRDLAHLIMLIEEKYKIVIHDDCAAEFGTVQDVVYYVKQARQEKRR